MPELWMSAEEEKGIPSSSNTGSGEKGFAVPPLSYGFPCSGTAASFPHCQLFPASKILIFVIMETSFLLMIFWEMPTLHTSGARPALRNFSRFKQVLSFVAEMESCRWCCQQKGAV